MQPILTDKYKVIKHRTLHSKVLCKYIKSAKTTLPGFHTPQWIIFFFLDLHLLETLLLQVFFFITCITEWVSFACTEITLLNTASASFAGSIFIMSS